jgi:hypothetical protein
MKLFRAVIYKLLLLARAFVPCKLIQPSLIFADKAGDYPREAPFRSTTLGKAPEAVFLVVCEPSMNEL